MKTKITVLFMCFHLLNAFAQNDEGQTAFNEKIVPPSPTATSLGKYGDIPVSNYTGIPNINIPLYTLKSGEIELPISLSYYGSGIKVGEESSWVGLGWSLNAGGVITRSVRGLDDLRRPEGYLTRIELPSNLSDLPDPTASEGLDFYYKEINNGQLDGAPDMFYFNFAGYSGKMVFERSKENIVKGIPLEQTNCIFLYDISKKQWTVTNEYGWKYYFGTTESSNNYSVSGQGSTPFKYSRLDTVTHINGTLVYPFDITPVITSWYLDRIETPNGDNMTFQYDTNERRTISQLSYSQSEYIQYLSYHSENGGLSDIGGGDTDNNVWFHPISANMTQTSDVYLKRIDFANGYLLFETEDRYDMRMKYNAASFGIAKPQRLSKMTQFNLSGIPNKRIVFNHSYFNESVNSYNKENYWRLKLNGLQEYSYNTTTNSFSSLAPYSFEYNMIPLPAKSSASVDYWGYYNGFNNDKIPYYRNLIYESWMGAKSGQSILVENSTDNMFKKSLLPKPIFIDPEDLNLEKYAGSSRGWHHFLDGAIREANPSTMEAGILKKITYPTGGATQFTFEPNSYNAYDDAKPYPKADKYINISAVSDYSKEPQTTNFSLTHNSQIWLTCKIENWGSVHSPGAYENIVAGLRKSDGSEIIKFKPTDEYTPFTANVQVFLPPGDYQIIASNNRDEEIQIALDASYVVRELSETKLGGGLRISKIEDRGISGQIFKSTKYDYNEYFGTYALSTGEIMTPITPFYFEGSISQIDPLSALGFLLNTDPGYSFGRTFVLVRTSENQVPLSNSASGSFVGYSKVSVYQTESGGASCGKSVYEYINKPDLFTPYAICGVPTIPQLDNGKLVSEEYFDGNGRLITKKLLSYAKNESTKRTIKGVVTPTAIYKIPWDPKIDISYYIRFYEIPSEWWYPLADTTYTYDSDGSGKFVKSYNSYQYGNINHKLLTKKITGNSNGGQIESTHRYVGDLNQGVYATMNQNNQLAYPVEEITKVRGGVVHSKLTTYKVDDGNYMPDSIYSLERVSPLDIFNEFNGVIKDSNYGLTPDIIYKDYNPKGRLIKAQEKNGLYSYYLWAYNNQYPVAKITSNINTSIEVAVNDANLSYSNNLQDVERDISYLKNILQGYFNSNDYQIGIYTYRPLVGMTSSTDPRGVTTYYEYDAFNRLKRTYIKENNVEKTVQSYDYHYQGQ